MRFGSRLVAAATALVAGPVVLGASSASADSRHAPLAAAGLTVGDQGRPLNVEGAPAFGWLPRDRDPGEVQSA